MSFTVMKALRRDRLLKRQDKFDSVIVFDENFVENQNKIIFNQPHVWLTFVDFCATFKYDHSDQCVNTASYDEVVLKANEWVNNLPQYKRTKNAFFWSVVNCETMYAKMTIVFNPNGEICEKKIIQISKWPIIDENYTNTSTLASKCIMDEVFSGRYIVLMLRVWFRKKNCFGEMIDSSPIIAFNDYLPQTMAADDYYQDKKISKEKKKRFNSGKDSKECLEKIEQIINRINLDILNQKFEGNILCVTTFPCYNLEENSINSKNVNIPIGSIVNVVRVFSLISRNQSNRSNNCQIDLIGFADFIPECISGGGFIKYPKFQTQSALIQKASKWMTQNPELKFLNCSSVDIKLRSMTSIDTGLMTFSRNTGDFIRILRVCYSKPNEDVDGNFEINPAESDDIILESKPPPAPIYLQCKSLFSSNNSNRELRKQMNEFLMKENWNDEIDVRKQWRFLMAESIAIFTKEEAKKNKKLNIDYDNSFHAISISTTGMNCSMFNAINIFYDVGFFEQENADNEQTNSETQIVDNSKAVVKTRCSIL